MNNLLKGLRIIEGSAFVAAPLGGMTLAQMGADVIRFDPIGGGIDYRRWPVTQDNMSLYWAGMNKAKRSIAVDIRQARGRELVSELITAPGEDAGLFLTNFPASGWLSYDALKQNRDDLIMLNITGTHDGATAVDYTVNAMLGFPYITGAGGAAQPVNNVVPAWDIATGYSAAAGLLAAERHRRLHGEGQLVTLALADVAMAMAGHLGYIGEVVINGTERAGHGNDIYGAFGRDFATADARRVMVIAISRRQWQALCQATGLGEKFSLLEQLLEVDLHDEGDRFMARDAIAVLLKPWCQAHTLAQIREAFDTHGVCWGVYQSFAELVNEDPRCSTANPLFQNIEQPGIGTYPTPGLALNFSASPRQAVRRAPLLGEHTDEILADIIGLSSAAIGRLHDANVVAGPEGMNL